MGGTGFQSGRLNGHVGARGAWSSRSTGSEETGAGEEEMVGTSSGACLWEERGGLWFSAGFLDEEDWGTI